MRKLTGYAILIFVLSSILVLDGCKRGENDPFFSFRSRKARVTGDWAFETFESNVTQLFSSGYKAIVNFKLNGNSITLVVDSINTPRDITKTTRGIVKEAFYKFDKNSKMEYLFHYELTIDSVSVDENTNVSTTYRYVWTIKDRATGSWNFLDGVEKNGVSKYKNKERLSLIFETFNTSTSYVFTTRSIDENGSDVGSYFYSTSSSSENKYANGENAEIWVITELRNKKIVMERDIDDLLETVNVTNDTINIGNHYQEKGFESCTLKPLQENQ